MATITTRTAKGSALTFTEVDGNFTNLNNDGISNSSSIANLQADKFDKAGGTITGATTVNATFTLGGKSVASTENNSQSGTAVSLTVPSAEIVRLTNASLVSVSGILAGSSGQKVVLVNRTNTTVEVENESSSALASSQIFTGTGGSLLLQSNASISLVYDYTTSRWNIVGGSGAGTGSGIINYIENPDASIGLTGYTTYDDGAAAPVDGSGGSPKSGLFVRSTTTPLRGSGDFNIVKTGATSYQGNGVAYDFTIDNADLAKVLTVTFDYEVVSGTYVDGDFTVYLIQDPTGTPVVIQPAGYKILAGTAGTKLKQIATFQTDSSVKNYRLCFHCATTSALDYTLALDNIVCGPQVVQYGAPVTDWTAYTPAAYVGLGTPTGVSIFYRRNGDSIDLMGQFTTGTVSGIPNSISLPAGLSIATGKGADSVKTVGRWYRDTASASTNKSGTVQIKGTESVFSFGSDSFTVAISPFNESVNGSAIFNSTEAVMFEAQGIPIQGWSSTVQMSNDTDTRVVSMQYSGNAGQALTANVTDIPFSTLSYDTHGAWNGSQYVVPVAGFYQVNGSVYITTQTALGYYIYLNGTKVWQLQNNRDTSEVKHISGFVYATAGQTISIRSDAAVTLSNASVYHWISINRLSGPSAIAASESVVAVYNTATAQVLSSGAVINYDTKEIDTHGAVTTGAGNWKFTCPVSGKYLVSAFFYNGAAGQNYIIVRQSTVNKSEGLATANTTTATQIILSCVAGDTIDATTSGLTLTANALYNKISITRIGN